MNTVKNFIVGVFTITVLLPIAIVTWPFQLLFDFFVNLGDEMRNGGEPK